MFAYCNDDPINHLDKDGHNTAALAYGWTGSAWWLTLVDGPLPIGDFIYFMGVLVFADLALYAGSSHNNSGLPSQGEVSEVDDAPPVDAGKQGKHVPNHPNNDGTKSQWEEGETGVRQTQEAWNNGTVVKPDGSVRIGVSSDGRWVKVHQDGKGRIHGYPVTGAIAMLK